MTNSKITQPFRLRLGECRACCGDGGQLVADYVDQDDRFYDFKFLTCSCCDGSGQDCSRCYPQLKNHDQR